MNKQTDRSTTRSMIGILLFEDHQEFAESLIDFFSGSDQIRLLHHARNAAQVVRLVQQYEPDIIIMDIDMPVCNGLEGLLKLREASLNIQVIMLTVFDDNERVFQAICRGASGYLLKTASPDSILQGILDAKNGGAPMTPSIARQVLRLFAGPYQQMQEQENLTHREQVVLSLLVRGFSYKMIATELNLGMETIRFHIKNIYSKLQVHSKSEAVAKALLKKP